RLRLAVDPGVAVLVRGYVGEPFLRFARGTVQADGASPTAEGLRLTSGKGWHVVAWGRSFTWRDARMAEPPSGAADQPSLARWSVPIVVDGRPALLNGELRRVDNPLLWPWVILAAVLLGGLAVAGRRRTDAAPALALAAGIATTVALLGFLLGPGSGSAGS